MSISLKTHKLLWGKSGNKCAYPDCKIDLVIDESETDDPSIVGEEAHIVSRKEDGPRGQSNLSLDERDRYDNLILLCSTHHKLIDDQENSHSVEILHELQKKHEDWVRRNLTVDKAKERDDLLYAGYVDRFIELAEVDRWKAWTSYIFGGGQPSVYQVNLRKLRELIEFLISRVWPQRYPELEKAFYNFKNISNDFLTVFEEHAERPSPSDEKYFDDDLLIWTKKFYHLDEWNPERYKTLHSKFEYHSLLVEDLALEMTRSANYLFEQVRHHIFPAFRIDEGVLLVEIGPFMDFSYQTVRTEYQTEEKKSLYPGLKEFMKIREDRSYFRGKGISNNYFRERF